LASQGLELQGRYPDATMSLRVRAGRSIGIETDSCSVKEPAC
jgi:hypothetical protein